MENKNLVKIVLAILIIGAIGLVAYNNSFKSTELTGLADSNSPYEYIGSSFTFTAYLTANGDSNSYNEDIDVSVVDSSDNVVEEFKIKGDGSDSKTVSDLNPGIYTVKFNYTGNYPYKPSSDSVQLNFTSSSKDQYLKDLKKEQDAANADFEDWYYHRG